MHSSNISSSVTPWEHCLIFPGAGGVITGKVLVPLNLSSNRFLSRAMWQQYSLAFPSSFSLLSSIRLSNKCFRSSARS